jgi:hypothetical protein
MNFKKRKEALVCPEAETIDFRFRACLLCCFFIFFLVRADGQNSIPDVMNSLPETDTDLKSPFIPIKSEFPDGLFRPLPDAFIGISDPGLDSVPAYDQAYLRALTLFALSDGLCKGLCDYFTEESGKKITTKYMDLVRFQSDRTIGTSSVKVTEPVCLKSGELILYLLIADGETSSKNCIQINAGATLFNQATNASQNELLNTKMILEDSWHSTETPGHKELLENTMANNIRVNKKSIFDGKNVLDNRLRLYYSSDPTSAEPRIHEKKYGTITYEGLWYALIHNLFYQLSAQSKQYFEKERNLNDLYGQKQLSLTREGGAFKYNFKLHDIQLSDNRLYVNLQAYFPESINKNR